MGGGLGERIILLNYRVDGRPSIKLSWNGRHPVPAVRKLQSRREAASLMPVVHRAHSCQRFDDVGVIPFSGDLLAARDLTGEGTLVVSLVSRIGGPW